MLKNKQLSLIALTILSLFAILCMACTLEGDLETLREEVANQQAYTTKPNTPTGVTATADSSSSITISWNPVSGATGYNIYRSSSASGTYNSAGSSSTASYTDTGLSANAAYYYRVSAYNNKGESSRSSYTSATTSSSGGGGGSGTESSPISLTANTWTDGSITSGTSGSAVWYSFNATSGTTYYVWMNQNRDGDGTKTLDIVVDFFENGENTGSQYYGWNSSIGLYFSSGTIKLKVYPTLFGDTGTFAIAYSTSSTRPATAVPTTPTGVTATAASSSSITVTWSSVSGATSYNIYRSSSASGTYISAGESSTASYTDTGLSANTTYYYKVAAVNSNGEGSQSEYASATTLSSDGGSSGTESNPIPLTANTWTDGSITSGTSGSAVWYSFNATSGTNYYIWWNDSHEGNSTKTLDVEASAYYSSGTSIFTGVDSGWSTSRSFAASSSGTVKIKVEPYTSGYTGTFAVVYSTSSTRPGTTVPTTPTGVTATAASSSSITVSWSSVSGATSYNIYRSSSASGTYISAGESSTASYTDTGLSANTTYYYKVDASNSLGTSSQSEYASATTSPSSSSPLDVPGATLAAKLTWLQSNAQSGGYYTVETNTNEGIGPQSLSYSGRSDITITLQGTGAVRTVSLSSNGSMFTVSSGVTLVLGNNITLQGRSGNSSSLVTVNSGGTLVMNTGSTVNGNTSSTYYGGGVSVDDGTFTMNGGTISGNTFSSSATSHGGGVFVINSGTFTMSGGTISGNTSSTSGSSSYSRGGGVYVGSGTFTMSGGTISGNTSSTSSTSSSYSSYSRGGGVYVGSGTFTMSGGTISGNTSSTSTASSSSSYGGGVYVDNGAFTMSGGTISGNTSYSRGGGVYVNSGTFSKTNGTIYGYSAGDTVNSNTVKNSSNTVVADQGHAVYASFSSSTYKRKETTAGPGANLTFDGTGSSASWSGDWDY